MEVQWSCCCVEKVSLVVCGKRMRSVVLFWIGYGDVGVFRNWVLGMSFEIGISEWENEFQNWKSLTHSEMRCYEMESFFFQNEISGSKKNL